MLIYFLYIFFLQKTDTSSLAQFYYADEELNLVAAELDSFDGRKDPERCTLLGELDLASAMIGLGSI